MVGRRSPAATAVLAAGVASLLGATAGADDSASWTTVGGSRWRIFQEQNVNLPSDTTGALLEQRTAVSAGAALPPVISGGTAAGGGYTTILADTSCAIRFLDKDFKQIGLWANCTTPEDTLRVAPSLSPAGDVLVVSTASGSVFAVDARAVSAGQQLWGPVQLADAPVATSLVTDVAAWLPGRNGTVYRLGLVDGYVASLPPAACYSVASDRILAPMTQITDDGIDPELVAAVTAGGCIVAINSANMTVAWRLEAPSGYAASSAVSAPPAVDVMLARLYFVSPDGYLCCAKTATAAAQGWSLCGTWTAACISLAPGTGVTMVGGVAVSPDNSGFHKGQLFLLDSSGVLHTVSADAGSALTSGASLTNSPVSAAPIVVPNGLDSLYNAMLTVGTNGLLQCVYVGDGPITDDDDSGSDDDGQGNGGIAWAVSTLPAGAASPSPVAVALPEPGGGARTTGASLALRRSQAAAAAAAAEARRRSLQGGGGVSMQSVGFALRADGKILIPLTDGSLAVVGPQHPPPAGVSPRVIIAVTTAVALVLALAAGLTLMFACRHRRRMREQAAAAAGGAGAWHSMTGGGADGGDGADASLVHALPLGDHEHYVAAAEGDGDDHVGEHGPSTMAVVHAYSPHAGGVPVNGSLNSALF